ncbi:MAG: hypothetical protein PHI64_11720 [Zoogloea sp.]|uniref:hypothetical protein n=1 Tax=Zoogloea sp. TaxID=49181 RepID=UPI0026307A31|nr:hypothetical protein [Zoogloea sp.]MDD2989615.1 hypothetical protein [Zoogloea sp.]
MPGSRHSGSVRVAPVLCLGALFLSVTALVPSAGISTTVAYGIGLILVVLMVIDGQVGVRAGEHTEAIT